MQDYILNVTNTLQRQSQSIEKKLNVSLKLEIVLLSADVLHRLIKQRRAKRCQLVLNAVSSELVKVLQKNGDDFLQSAADQLVYANETLERRTLNFLSIFNIVSPNAGVHVAGRLINPPTFATFVS